MRWNVLFTCGGRVGQNHLISRLLVKISEQGEDYLTDFPLREVLGRGKQAEKFETERSGASDHATDQSLGRFSEGRGLEVSADCLFALQSVPPAGHSPLFQPFL